MDAPPDPLALDVEAMGRRFADLESAIELRRGILIRAHKPSRDAQSLSGFLAPLLIQRDDRSDWRAMVDSWRLRHFAAGFAAALRAGYAWRFEETPEFALVTFSPPAAQPANEPETGKDLSV